MNPIWAPFPGFQTRAIAAEEDEVFLGGSKGPGKTDLIIAKHLPWVHIPGGKALLVRETFRQARELIDRMHRLVAGLPTSQRPAYVGNPAPRFTWPSGHVTEIGQVRSLADVYSYHGREWWYIGHDEAGNERDERIIDEMQAEIRSKVPGLPRMWVGSGNPGRPGHQWTKRRFVKPTQHGRIVYEAKRRLPNGVELSSKRRFVPGYVWDNPIYRNDARYISRLMALPPMRRAQLLFGDYDVGGGLGFEELDEQVHRVPAFKIPDHWPQWAGYDWGYAHPAAYVRFAMGEDGDIYVTRALRMWRKSDPAQAEQVRRMDPKAREIPVYAGRGAFDVGKAHGEMPSPSPADVFATEGITLLPGKDAKVTKRRVGVDLTRWQQAGVDGEDITPRLRFFDTAEVNECFLQWQDAVEDPDDPEVLLKVDADRETGEGGDDLLDAALVGLASFVETPSEIEPTTPDDAAWARARQVGRTRRGSGSGMGGEVLS